MDIKAAAREFEAERDAAKQQWENQYGHLLAGFHVNDVVRLISGGPNMTVERIQALEGSQLGGPRASCKWFDNHGRVQAATFELAQLTKVDPEAGRLGRRY